MTAIDNKAAPTSSTATTAPKKVSAPPFKLSTTKTANKWLKILMYGAHGCGKTTLAATSVDVDQMGDVFMVNAESGEMTITDNDRIKNPEGIALAEVNSFKQFVKVYEFLSSHCSLRDKALAGDETAKQKMRVYESALTGIPADEIEEPKMFRTIIVDSLSEIEGYLFNQLLGVSDTFDPANFDADDMETAGFTEYKKNNNMINRIVRAFRDLPINLIVICAQAYTEDEQKRKHYAPALSGKLGTQVQGYFDIVGYLVTGKPGTKQVGNKTVTTPAPRRMYIQPGNKWDAKNRRSSYKESFFENPTMGSILKSIGLLRDAN